MGAGSFCPLPFTGEGDHAQRGGEGGRKRSIAGVGEGIVFVAPPSTALRAVPLPRKRGRNDSGYFGGRT
jgi:hypothetical protein